ncbi:MAG: hypothetical protein AB7U92_19695 [Piscinibacter sp.]|uniref:hypothetical protein n=1 Tax=Piscinibacter sp. TaxID=1903157 RepID=UPI003D0ECC8D
MRTLFPVSLSLASAFLLVGCLQEVPVERGPILPTAEPQARFDQATQAFRGGRHAHAYARFAALADAGHVPSAQIALVMHRHGSGLFGSDWAATPWQQERWTALVVNAARQRIDVEDNDRGD